MKAIVYTQYGSPDVLRLDEVTKPTPKPDQVLVKVHAASINAADSLFLKGESALVRLMAGGLNRPKQTILGSDVAGIVESVGAAVNRFKPGDAVLGDLSNAGFGGLAEYVAMPETYLTLKPDAVRFEDAAAIPLAGVTALQGVRDKGQVQAGQQVLIYGASGGVGVYLVQIAKAYGAEVTAVCSTGKVEMVRGLGADHVIDYTKDDFLHSGRQYDVILAANGYRPITDYQRALKPGGTYVMVGGKMTQIFQAMLLGPFLSMTGNKKMTNLMAKSNAQDLAVLADMLATGKLKPIIDHSFPLSQAADAFRYLVQGHARGKVVIQVVA
ncbi:MAG TPA: NAD(P)-dependent alcohol dehydrogenase [Aggregatilineales bacterium]|nr:NAD(P)-dependent alcohol dehydrogenase [Aggregatilineales bacterium]